LIARKRATLSAPTSASRPRSALRRATQAAGLVKLPA